MRFWPGKSERPAKALDRPARPGVRLLITWLFFCAVPICLYFFFWAPQNESHLTSDDFQRLSVAGDEIRSKIDSFVSILATDAERNSREPPDLLNQRLHPPEFRYEACDPEPPPAGVPTQPLDVTLAPSNNNVGIHLRPDWPTVPSKVRVAIVQGTGGYELHFRYVRGRGTLCAFAAAPALAQPSFSRIPADTFDDLILARSDGVVLLEDRREAALSLTGIKSISDLAQLQDRPPQPQSDKGTASAGSNHPILPESSLEFESKIGGGKYKVLLQPVSMALEQIGADPASGPSRLIVVGLIDSDKFSSRTLRLPARYVVYVGFGVLILLVALWPFLKLWTMEPTERFRSSEVLWFSFSILLAARLLTLVWVYSVHLGDTKAVQGNLKRFADRIELNLTNEIEAALNVIDSASGDPLAAFMKQNPGKSYATKENSLDKTAFTGFSLSNSGYPWLDQLFWTNAVGMQRVKWSVKSRATDQTDISEKLPEFGALSAGSAWALKPSAPPAKPHGPFVVDSIYSPNTGEYLATILERLPLPPPGLPFGAVATQLISVTQPVAQDGYSFAVFDRTGIVKFASQQERNGREDIFGAWSDPGCLKDGLEFQVAAGCSGEYHNVHQQAWVQPFGKIANSGWALVVFYDLTAHDRFLFDSLILAFTATMLFGAVSGLCIVAVAGFLYSLGMKAWYRPQPRQNISLTVIAIGLAVLAVLFFDALRGSYEERKWAIVGIPAVTLALLLLTGFLHNVCASRKTRFEQWDMTYLGWIYAVTGTLIVFMLAVFPTTGLFNMAMNQEQLNYTADEQMTFWSAMEHRRNFAAERYRADTTLATKRLTQTWDLYDFGELSSCGKEPGKERPGELGRNSLIAALAKLTAYVPHLQPAIAKPGRQFLSTWSWGIRDGSGSERFLELKQPAPVGVSDRCLVGNVADVSWPLPLDKLGLMGAFVLFALAINAMVVRRFGLEYDFRAWELAPEVTARNLLIIVPPGYDARRYSHGSGPVTIVDTEELASVGRWETNVTRGLIVLDHFGVGLDDADLNAKRLDFIEYLLHSRGLRVVILSTTDPIFWLFGEVLAGEVRASSAGPTESALRRWSDVLSSFDGPYLPPNPDGGIVTAADAAYPSEVWRTCAAREKISLHQLACDGVVNPRNGFALEHLVSRGLVRHDEPRAQYVIANDAFRDYCGNIKVTRDLIYGSPRTETAWILFKRIFVVTAVALAIFLVLAWQNILEAGFSRFTGVATIISSVGGAFYTLLPRLMQLVFNKGGDDDSHSA